MRILLLSTYFRPDIASTGVIMSTLADQFVARGHEVTVLTSVPHYGGSRVAEEFSGKACVTERKNGMTIHRLYTHVARNRANIFSRLLSYGSFSALSFSKGAFVRKHDVILAPSPPLSNGVIADLLGRIHNTPYVYNVQDIWPDVAVRAGVLKDEKNIRRLKRMENYIYRRAARLVVISDGFRQNLLGKGVPDEKISVIPNFIDSGFVTPGSKDNEFSRAHGLTGKFVVLFAGNMGFSQNLENVLEAAKLVEGVSQIVFLMVGEGAGRSKAEERLKELRIDNVVFLPFQPHERVPDMYRAADVCLIPLRRGFTTESVPCKLFTIMAAGKPAIAAVDYDSDTWKLIDRYQCGICVDPENPKALAESVLHYFRNESDRLDAGRNARACTDTNFHPTAISDAYLDALHSAVEGKRKHSLPIQQTSAE